MAGRRLNIGCVTEVGRVTVDSGLVHLGDPLFLTPDELNENPYQNWEEISEKAFQEAKNGAYLHKNRHLGMIITDFGGDGDYPVYVEEDETGFVKRVIIDFSGEVDRVAHLHQGRKMTETEKAYWDLGYKMGTTLRATSLNEAKAKWAHLEDGQKETAQQAFYLGAEEGRKAKEQAN